jgi:hypothetical protein
MRYQFFIAIATALISTEICQAQIFRPYKCGPVLKKDDIQTFERLNDYLEISSGDSFAEIGASSGYYNGAMAVFLDSVTFYLQDIDRDCLNENNLQKVLRHYSKFRKSPITATNSFHIVIGSETKTNLPINAIDIIFSNATYHVLDQPDAIISDLYQSLRYDGSLAIRDEFVYDGSIKYCPDKNCKNPLTKFEDFQATMERNGFVMVHQTDQFGYPVYKFRKK